MKKLLFLVSWSLALTLAQQAMAVQIVLEEGVNGYSGTADNTIFEENPDNTNGAHRYLYAGNTKISDARRLLIRFDLGSIPQGSIIQSARLEFVVQRRASQALNENHSLHRLTRDWGEGTADAQIGNPESDGGSGTRAQTGDATWSSNHFNQSLWLTQGGDFITSATATAAMGPVGTRVGFTGPDMAADVQSWVHDPSANFGWIMIGDESAPQNAYRFHSSEGLNGSRPRLIINLDPPVLGPVPPKLRDPGDIIIGDIEGSSVTATSSATAANFFVYPDAINLDSIVFDDITSDDQIKWSFTGGAGRILINAVGPLDGGLAGFNQDDPTSPRLTSRLDLNDGDLEQIDGNPRSITFRNATLSPMGGPNVEPGLNGILQGETTMITLFASDGTTFTSRSITVYTANNTTDSLTGGIAGFVGEEDFRQVGSTTGWLSSDSGTPGVLALAGAEGLCMTVPGPGQNFVTWLSPERYFELIDDRVYRVRASLTTDQFLSDAIPLFFFTYDNFNSSGVGNNYGGFSWILDVDGGAQGIGRKQGRAVYDFWLTPNAVAVPQWRVAAFTPEADATNDPRLSFRIIDANDSILTQNDFGTLCVGGIQIEGFSRADLAVEAVAYSTPISSATHFTDTLSSAGLALIDDVDNSAIIRLNTVGDDRADLGPFDGAASDFNSQLYPVAWSAETLYRVRVRIRSLSGGFDPVDAIFTAADVTNSELGMVSFSTRGAGGDWTNMAASPLLAPAEYEAYFFGQNATASQTPNAARLRPLAFFFNTNNLFGPDTGGDPFVIEGLEMDRMTAQD